MGAVPPFALNPRPFHRGRRRPARLKRRCSSTPAVSTGRRSSTRRELEIAAGRANGPDRVAGRRQSGRHLRPRTGERGRFPSRCWAIRIDVMREASGAGRPLQAVARAPDAANISTSPDKSYSGRWRTRRLVSPSVPATMPSPSIPSTSTVRFHNRGLGAAILGKAQRADAPRQAIRLDCCRSIRADRFYERHGFRKIRKTRSNATHERPIPKTYGPKI